MIKYQLICNQAHEFEGWFQTSQAFDSQNASGLVTCPVCNSASVRRALMAPNLASPKRRQAAIEATRKVASAGGAAGPAATKPPMPAMVPGTSPTAETVAAFGAALAEWRRVQRKIQDECRYVGDDFAEEARKIHYGEADPENIYGQSSPEECEELAEEGITVTAIPWLPSEH
jgi:hypothetical protein